MMEKVGFIGLGIMGQGMAANILKAGFELTVWNRTAGKSEQLSASGAIVADSLSELATECDIICLCVSDTADVQQVITGVNGLLPVLRPGSLVIDMSTISPAATRELGKKLNERSVFMLDAPVSGGSEGAALGMLSIMVGGEAEQFERARPLLEAMGKTITHVGPGGSGQAVKLVNQILVVNNMMAVSEALIFAQASGLDLEKTVAAVSGGAAGSWMLANRGTQAVKRDWRPGFTIDLQQKDLRLVLEAADELAVPVTATSAVFNLYRTLQAAGLGSEGNHALIKALERLSGIEVGVAQ